MNPYQILVLRNTRNTGTTKLPVLAFATCKKITPQKLHLKRELREESCKGLVPRYATMAKDVNIVKRSYRAQGFAWQYWREKSVVRFRKNVGVLLNKQYVFKHIVLGAGSVLTAPNDVLSEKFIVLF